MVLNALNVDPMKTWKGMWRWYDEYSLNLCCISVEDFRRGLSIEEMTFLARCNSLNTQTFRAAETEIPEALIRGKKATILEKPDQNDVHEVN